MTSEELEKARKYLSKKDPVLGRVIKKVPPFKQRIGGNYFLDLIESIVSQQLSIKAADTIWRQKQLKAGFSLNSLRS